MLTKPAIATFDITEENPPIIASKLINRDENTSYATQQSRQQDRKKTLLDKISEGQKNTISRSEKKSVASFEIKRNTTTTMIKQTLLSKPVLQEKHKNSLNSNVNYNYSLPKPPSETDEKPNLQVSDNKTQNEVESQSKAVISPNSDKFSNLKLDLPPVS